MKKTYIKRNFKYWTAKKLNKHSMKIWYFVAVCMALVTVWAVINRQVNSGELVDPRVSHVVPQVMASEVVISCEDPKGYLECQAYQGKITWEEHDRLYKIIECESKWNPEAMNTKNSNGSYDMGLLQINSIHKDISNSDKLNYKKSIDWAINKFKKDGNFNAWVCNRLVK